MPPVRVKVYGLFSFTRRGYLYEAVVEFLLLIAILSFWVTGYPRYRKIMIELESRTTWTDLTLILFDAIPYILTVLVLVKFMEMYLVLGAFARKETAAQQAPPPPPIVPIADPVTPPPSPPDFRITSGSG